MRLFSPGETFPPARFGISGSTGAATNADSTPTLAVYRNGILDSGVSVTVTNPSTGEYTFTFTIPGGYALGDLVSVRATATVGGIVLAPQELVSFRLDTKIATRSVAGDAMALTAGERTTLSGVVKTTMEAGGSTLATLLSRVPGTVAMLSDLTSQINALNQSASRRITCAVTSPWERPETGNNTYTIEVRTWDGDGMATNATANPTLTITGAVTGSLAANLSAISNPATGVYRWSYTVGAGHALEEIRADVSAIMADGTFGTSGLTQTADFLAADFTATDRSRLVNIEALADALPLLSEIMAQVERAGGPLLLTQADAAAARTRVELGVPNAAPNTNNGLPIKSGIPGAAPTVSEISNQIEREGGMLESLTAGGGEIFLGRSPYKLSLLDFGPDESISGFVGDKLRLRCQLRDADGLGIPATGTLTASLTDLAGVSAGTPTVEVISAELGQILVKTTLPATPGHCRLVVRRNVSSEDDARFGPILIEVNRA